MGNLDGIWESRYVYSGGESFHRVQVDDSAEPISVKSLQNEEGSELQMTLVRNGHILGGSWQEVTSPSVFIKVLFLTVM